MDLVSVYRTNDGKYFEDQDQAILHEKRLNQDRIYKLKEQYVREKLKECIYGKLFINEYESRKSNVTPDRPLVHVLIQNTNLVKEIIKDLENIN